MIEAGAKIVLSMLLLSGSAASDQGEFREASARIAQISEAVLPEPLRIPGPSLVEDKRSLNPKLPREVTGGVLARQRQTKVRFS